MRGPLVARDRELAAVEAAWNPGSCQGVVVAGAAGVGKTWLAQECLARAVQAGFKGRVATATAAAGTVPLGAVAHLIPAGADLSDPVQAQQSEEVLAEADVRARTEQEILTVSMARTRNLFWRAARPHEALALNEAAARRVTSEGARRMLRCNEGSMRISCGEPTRGLAMLAELGDDIRSAPDRVAWLTGVFMKPFGLAMTGQTAPAIALAERSFATGRSTPDQALFLHPAAPLLGLCSALRWSGALDRARETGEGAYRELSAARSSTALWMANVLGEVELLRGDPAAARRWYAEAAAQARTTHNTSVLSPALNGLATCAALLGDLDTAQQAAREADSLPILGMFLDGQCHARAWLAAARGNFTEARAQLAEGAERARAAGRLPAEALLLADIARLGTPKAVADRLAELARASDGLLVPAVARLAAALAADDPDQLMAAAGELAAVGADLMTAEAATVAAVGYRAAGKARKATAAGQLASAHLARCEGVRTPLLATAQTTAALTSREREIVFMASHGATSQDIAEKLHLSVRTVNNHLQHAYAKLGVTDRRTLAGVLRGTPTP